jgi:hypothetical protein
MTVKTPIAMVTSLLAVLAFAAAPALAAEAPAIEAESAFGVTHTGASFSAVINPKLQPVTACEFRFSGGISAVACNPSAGELGEGEEGVGTGASLEGLTPNTEYQYEALATNATGTTEGFIAIGDQTFLTLPNPPTVSTGGHSVTGPTTATVSGSVNPGSSSAGIVSPQAALQDDTTYDVEYGGTAAYGKRTPVGDAGEGESAVAETVSLEGLEPGRTYHYRIVASNLDDAGELNANLPGVYGTLIPQVVYGQDEEFTTPATPPVLSGVSVQGVTQSAATIAATLESQGLPTRYELQLGATPGLLQPIASGETSGTTPLSLTAGSLSAGTTYYYKLLAINPNDTVEPVSAAGSFTTVAAPAAAALAGLPAVIPYQSIAELNAKEAKEDKALPNPVSTKTLTKAEKLKKALKACHSKKGKKRTKCEAAAQKKFGSSKKKKA